MLRQLSCVAAAFLLALTAGCSRPADEETLRRTISAMQDAVEERSLSGVMDHVTDDFGGSNGMDTQMLRRILQGQIITNKSLGATIGPIDVEIQGERATARFSIILTGGSGGYLPERGRAYTITSGWRIEGGEWKVFVAEWAD